MSREKLMAQAEVLEWLMRQGGLSGMAHNRATVQARKLRARAESMEPHSPHRQCGCVDCEDALGEQINGAARGDEGQNPSINSTYRDAGEGRDLAQSQDNPAAAPPSAQPVACLCCGTRTSGVAIQHAECAEAVICASCVEVLRAAPDLAARVARLEGLLRETRQFGAFGVGSTLAERIRAALAEGEE